MVPSFTTQIYTFSLINISLTLDDINSKTLTLQNVIEKLQIFKTS